MIMTIGKIALGLCFLDAFLVLKIVSDRYPSLWKQLGPSTKMPRFLAVLYRVGSVGRRGPSRWAEFPDDAVLKGAWISVGALGDVAVLFLLAGTILSWLRR